MDLEAAATELYALAPAEFTGRRAELVQAARAAGDKDLARQVAELRKPTVSAWLVNRLVSDGAAAAQVEQLEPLGDRLRAAQGALDAPLMKELNRERQGLVAALVRRALAGEKSGAAVQRELEETLGAAIADEQAALAVLSGRLTRALAYSGFGDVDVSAATATPIRAVAKIRPANGETNDETRARAKAALDQAQAELLAAEAAAQESTARLERVQAQEAELSGQLAQLQEQIVRLRHELDGVSRSVASAEREQERARRRAREAAKQVQAAELALD